MKGCGTAAGTDSTRRGAGGTRAAGAYAHINLI
jgi:hypothetical protein